MIEGRVCQAPHAYSQRGQQLDAITMAPMQIPWAYRQMGPRLDAHDPCCRMDVRATLPIFLGDGSPDWTPAPRKARKDDRRQHAPSAKERCRQHLARAGLNRPVDLGLTPG